jgi:hypothetical protein
MMACEKGRSQHYGPDEFAEFYGGNLTMTDQTRTNSHQLSSKFEPDVDVRVAGKRERESQLSLKEYCRQYPNDVAELYNANFQTFFHPNPT